MDRRLLPLCLLAAAGCSLPTRDNALDGAIQPVASLQFVQGEFASDGSCVLAGANTPIVSIYRERCLGIDASESYDQEEGDTLSYEFFWTDSAGDVVVHQTLDPYWLVHPDELRQLPVGIHTFGVRVSDSHALFDVADGDIQLQNDPPVIPRFVPISLVAGGPPWVSPPGNWDLPLDASSAYDPNGDVLNYCWTLPTGEICSGNPNDPMFTLVIPPTFTGRMVLPLTVTDSNGNRATERLVVSVHEENAWGGALGVSVFAGVRRIDTTIGSLSVLPIPQFSGQPDLVRVPNKDLAVMSYEDGTTPNHHYVRTVDTVAMTSLDTEILTNDENVDVAVSPDGTAVFLASQDGSSNVTIHRYDLDPAGQLSPGVPGTPFTLSNESQIQLSPQLEASEDGTLWIHRSRSTVKHVTPDGAVLGEYTGGGRVLAMRPRPGSAQTWYSRSPGPSDLPGPVSLQSVENDVETVIDLGLGHLTDFVWIDETQFWLGLETKMVLVDADVLLGGGGLAAATVAEADVPFAFGMVPDRQLGQVWAISVFSVSATLVDEAGSILLDQALTEFEFATMVDGKGRLWTWDDTTNAFSAGEQPFGVVLAEGSTGIPHAGSHDGRGGIWYVTTAFLTPPALVHTAEDGTQDRVEFTVRRDGIDQPMPSWVASLRTTPGSETDAYSYSFDQSVFPVKVSMRHYDLSQTPPVETIVLGSNEALALGGVTVPVLEPSAPIPSSTPFFWTVFGGTPAATIPGRVGQLSGDFTTFTPRYTLVNGERDHLRAARSQRSNGLCLGTVSDPDNLSDVFSARWISESGTVTTFLSVGGQTNHTDVPSVATSPETDGTGDLCWVAQQAPAAGCTFGAGTVRAWTPAGALPVIYSPSPAGQIRSIHPISKDRFWLVMQRCDSQSQAVYDMDLVQRNVAGTLVRTATYEDVNIQNFLGGENSQDDLFFPIP